MYGCTSSVHRGAGPSRVIIGVFLGTVLEAQFFVPVLVSLHRIVVVMVQTADGDVESALDHICQPERSGSGWESETLRNKT